MSKNTEKKAEPVRIWAKAQPVKAAAAVASKDKSRPILGAVELESGNDVWRVVATDSYRLAMFEAGHVDAEQNTARICIAADHAAKAIKATDDVIEVLEVNEAEKLAKVCIIGRKGVRRVDYWPIVEGKFPDWRRLKPSSTSPQSIDSSAVCLNGELLAGLLNAADKAMRTARVTMWAERHDKPVYVSAETSDFRFLGLLMPTISEHLANLAEEHDKNAHKAAGDSSAEHAAELEDVRLKSWDEGYNAAKKALAEKFEREKAAAVAEALEACEKAQKAAEVPPAPKAPEPQKPAQPELEKATEATKAEKPAEKAQKIEAEEQPEDLAELAARFPELAFVRKSAGACIWCTGDTKPRKEELKAAGFRWSGKRQAWYKAPEKAEDQAA